jgi:phage FluMu gp28-like protein
MRTALQPLTAERKKSLSPYAALPRTELDALESWLSTFYEFQLDWVLDHSLRAILCKGRQIGMSHSSAAIALIWSIYHGELTTIISKGQPESHEVLGYARKHLQILEGLGSSLAKPTTDNAVGLEFPSGGRVLALPSTGGRGYSGNMILDEAAYLQHFQQAYDAAAGATTLGHRLRVVSTPNGAGNGFAELWQLAHDPKLGWSPHEVMLETAVAQGYPVDLEECWRRANGDPRLFDQLYRCKFLDTELQYIPSDLFGRCFDIADDTDGGACFGGLDIGETRDRTVLSIVRRKRGQRRLIHIESHAHTDDELIQKLTEKAFSSAYGCQRLAVDATGLGTFPAKSLRRKWGRRLEPVDFTLNTKEDLATGLYDVVSKGELSLPQQYLFNGVDEVPLLRDDVYAIRRIVTSAGNVRYNAQRTQRGHADRAWALMLANHAAGRMSAMFAALQ